MTLLKPWWWLPLGRVPEISARDLHTELTGGQRLQLLDVRTLMEWRSSHIEGAVSVPITSFRERLADLELDPGLPTVAICLSAHRSIPAVRWLGRAGFANARQLQGGMRAWWKVGLPTASGR